MIRYAAIWLLDWVDALILRHRCRRYCCWVANHPWWGELTSAAPGAPRPRNTHR